MAFPPKPNMQQFGKSKQSAPVSPQHDDAKKHKGVPPKPTGHGTPPPQPKPHAVSQK